MLSCIYKITNTVTGQFYIGSAVSYKRRTARHLTDLRGNYHPNSRLQRNFNKYGEAAFKVSIHKIVSNPEHLIGWEQFFIDTDKPVFNLSPVAGSNLGVKYSAESRERMSQAQRGIRRKGGWKQSAEAKAKIATARQGKGNGMYGNTHTPEIRKIISETSKSRLDRPETQAALALGRGWNKGIPFSRESRQKMSDAKPKKPVNRINLDTGEILYYPSVRGAEKDGFHVGHVIDCAKGKYKTHQGFVWVYA